MPVTINGSTGLTGVAAIDSVSSTELGYLDGVSSAIQTQIDTKASIGSAAPYRMAAGQATVGTTAVVITFPASRFTYAPRVTATNTNLDASGNNVRLKTITTSGFYASMDGGGSTSVDWIAIQMTSTGASG